MYTDNRAFNVFGPVFLFGSGVAEGQSAAGMYIVIRFTNLCMKLNFTVMCSGNASYFSMDIIYTASWSAQEDRVDFVLAANSSQQWLSIGFTDKQMMVSVFTYILVAVSYGCSIKNLIILLGPLITMEFTLWMIGMHACVLLYVLLV